ncbi:ABC transporter substrate-binding protein [Actinomadura madurae]|uniref:ABC transporter substrate-binding protein n=1 Tax=Actinomadura madurae TaxID=1993 RepID=UPI00399B2DF3
MGALDWPGGDSTADLPGLSRRSVLAGGLGIGAGLLLAGCSSSSSSSRSPAALPSALPGGTPVPGGTLRVGVASGGPSENLFPGTAAVGPDFIRVAQLFTPLFYAGSGDKLFPLEPGLALSAEPNADATSWTFRLRDGVTWHDGKSFGAHDVVYDLRTWMSDPATNYGAGFLLGLVDFANVKAVDKLTVRVPLKRPYAQFPTLFTHYNLWITPEGKTPAEIARNPIGTGAFKFQSFTAGKQSVLVRNPNFWDAPKPYFESVVVESSFSDSTAMVNALLAGSIDIASSPDYAVAAQQRSNPKVVLLESKSAYAQPVFAMRVDQGPFADVRVRQAFKYLVNRQQLIDSAAAGFGHVAYDLVGPGNQYYATDLKREFDPDKARGLFKAAGVLGETFVLPSPPIIGLDKAATVLAQQAKAAGVNVQVKTTSPATYWTPAEQVYVRPFAVDYIFAFASLAGVYSAHVLQDAPFRDTWWGKQSPGGRQANDLILQAMATLDETKAASLWREVQQQQFDEGGYLCWSNQPWLDIVSPRLRGLKQTGGINLNVSRFSDGWFAK